MFHDTVSVTQVSGQCVSATLQVMDFVSLDCFQWQYNRIRWFMCSFKGSLGKVSARGSTHGTSATV
jgi:hypothetical protein